MVLKQKQIVQREKDIRGNRDYLLTPSLSTSNKLTATLLKVYAKRKCN
jgi:hypothetical protein